MPSDKRYEVRLNELKVRLKNPPRTDQILEFFDLGRSREPFGSFSRLGRYVRTNEETWLLDARIRSFLSLTPPIEHRIFNFDLSYKFETDVDFFKVNPVHFKYSLAREFEAKIHEMFGPDALTFIELGYVVPGSIKGGMTVGAIVLGLSEFFANYSEMKAGFKDFLSDLEYQSGAMESALQSAMKTNEDDDNPAPDNHTEVWIQKDRRRRKPIE